MLSKMSTNDCFDYGFILAWTEVFSNLSFPSMRGGAAASSRTAAAVALVPDGGGVCFIISWQGQAGAMQIATKPSMRLINSPSYGVEGLPYHKPAIVLRNCDWFVPAGAGD
ncbi:hypothetical protein EJB05_33823 [Eragrostis curvula]|uniref:Uncharacterized protein n=1 Tax=Eragrostis curvula TaxID=38414 RepID=A0A5J9U2U6_9POAL|nr:hypothetical protein EJB05_33823 [Eragrostis curvula]